MTRKLVGLVLVAGAAASLGVAFASCNPAEGCTPENCTAVMDSCRMELEGDPYGLCYQTVSKASGTLPASDQRVALSNASCVKACQRVGSGRLLACVSSNSAQCSGATSTDRVKASEAVLDGCATKSLGTHDPGCQDTCYATLRSCVATCPSTSFDACMPCGNTCADAWFKCDQDC